MVRRRATRLRAYDYSQPGAYFVTICSHRRDPIFGTLHERSIKLNRAGQIVTTWWRLLPYRYPRITLDEFVVMPDHIHAIVIISDLAHSSVGEIHEFPLRVEPESPTLPDITAVKSETRIARRRMILPLVIGYFKMNTAKAINGFRTTPGVPVWQRSYYERIIRNQIELNQVREYILNNPLALDLDI